MINNNNKKSELLKISSIGDDTIIIARGCKLGFEIYLLIVTDTDGIIKNQIEAVSEYGIMKAYQRYINKRFNNNKRKGA